MCLTSPPHTHTSSHTQRQFTLQDLQNLVGTLLGMEGPTLDPGAPLASLGLTSTLAIQLVPALEHALGGGVSLPPTLPFDAPTLQEMLAYITPLCSTQCPSPPQVAMPAHTSLIMPPPQSHPAAHGGVAYVLGSAARLPGDRGFASTTTARDAITMVPLGRWDVDHHAMGLTGDVHAVPAARFGGFVGGPEMWDPEPFGVTMAEALHMDPQQRLVLDVVAGVGGVGVGDGQCGVFVGVSQVWW